MLSYHSRTAPILVILFHCSCVLVLLWKSAGHPYVMDNNESYSTLWHAANLLNFDLSTSAGLADEAFSPHDAAHPFVHTHQGNWPRLFGALIYWFGADSISGQIAVTALLIGSMGIGVVFLFFRRAVGPGFATILCLLLTTDYVLWLQWQVVTYRVWYGLLFFAPLLGIEMLRDGRGQRAAFLLVGSAAFASFYFELVFAAFTSLTFAFYLAATRDIERRRKLVVFVVFALCGGAALGILLIQLVAYLGVDGALFDLWSTYVARNHVDPQVAAAVEEFYKNHNIAFWKNYQDSKKYLSKHQMIWSIFAYDLQIHTPYLAGLLLILAGARLLPQIVPGRRSGGRLEVGLWGVIWAGAAGLFFVLLDDAAIHGMAPAGMATGLTPLRVAIAILLAALLVWVVREAILRRAPSPWAALYFPILLVYYVLLQHRVFEQDFREVWVGILGGAAFLPALLAGAVIVMGFGLLVVSSASTVRPPSRRLLAFLVCGFAAYAIVYLLAPGYVRTGYLERHAPFSVFLTAPLLASGIHLCLAGAGNRLGNFWGKSAATFLVAIWAIVQVTLIRNLPPDHYAFLQKLAAAPYAGHGMVVNNYAAPVAAQSGNWAYYDPELQSGKLEQGALVRDFSYLWLADWRHLEKYAKPDYFICMIPQQPSHLIRRFSSTPELWMDRGCTSAGILNLPPEAPVTATLVESDPNETTLGYSYWAIVRLEWK